MSSRESKQSQRGEVVVVYALQDAQHLVTVAHWPGMTAAEAVAGSGLPAQFPEIDFDHLVLGLYGRQIEPTQRVAPGDRIEICRPLQRDPREMRRYMTARGLVIGQKDAGEDS